LFDYFYGEDFIYSLVRTNNRGSGFSLIEIVALISVLSLLITVTVPTYITHQRNCRAATMAKSFRTYATAFRNYSMEEQSWPLNAHPGMIPPGMEEKLPRFDEESVLGGKWDWEPHTSDCNASISLMHPKDSESVISRIDEILDDGNVHTGDLVLEGDRITFYLPD
jgi:type II secretory pathway pseudopilin PulG